MPTYEYQCGDCEYRFEQLQKITEDTLKTCPSCGKDALRRLVSAPAFHLKGSGWYKTDYASSSSSANSSSSSSTSSDNAGSASSTANGDSSSTTNSTSSETKLTSSDSKNSTSSETKSAT